MRAIDLWERFMWQYFMAFACLIIGELVPLRGLSIGFLCLMTLSFFWVISRIRSYQPTSEGERLSRLATLKLGSSLVSAGLALIGVFLIVSQIMGTAEISLFTSPTIYLLVLLGCGLLACAIGIILMIYVLRTRSSTTLRDREHP